MSPDTATRQHSRPFVFIRGWYWRPGRPCGATRSCRRLLLVPRQATGNSIASETNRCRGSSMSKNRPTHSESVPGRPVPATVRPQSPIGATASMPTPRPDKPPSNNRRALDTADGFDPRSRQAHPCSCVSIRGSRPEAERTLRRCPGMSRRYGNASTFVSIRGFFQPMITRRRR